MTIWLGELLILREVVNLCSVAPLYAEQHMIKMHLCVDEYVKMSCSAFR